MLVIVSGRMLREAYSSKEGQEKEVDVSGGFMLLTLSIATSIDALAVGLSFALLNVNIALTSPTIGVVAFTATTVGFILGKRASRLMGKRTEAIGASVLLVIAFRILLTHIL